MDMKTPEIRSITSGVLNRSAPQEKMCYYKRQQLHTHTVSIEQQDAESSFHSWTSSN